MQAGKLFRRGQEEKNPNQVVFYEDNAAALAVHYNNDLKLHVF